MNLIKTRGNTGRLIILRVASLLEGRGAAVAQQLSQQQQQLCRSSSSSVAAAAAGAAAAADAVLAAARAAAAAARAQLQPVNIYMAFFSYNGYSAPDRTGTSTGLPTPCVFSSPSPPGACYIYLFPPDCD